MKSRLFIIILTILIYSCGQNSKSGKTSNSPIITQDSINHKSKNSGVLNKNEKDLSINSMNDTSFSMIIRDSSLYSVSFLKSLKPQKAHWKFYLDGDQLIINGSDTVLLPNALPLNKVIFFTGRKGDLRINLFAKRILLSTIDYKIEVIKNNNPPTIKSGLADLSPYFFLRSKMDEVDSTGYSYDSTEYWDINGDYLTSIRIGKARDNNKSLLGKVECKLTSIEINPDNCPTLIQK